jgi:hypothetical protein
LNEIFRFYGFERCKLAILNAKFLKNNAISIASLVFNIPKKQFHATLRNRHTYTFRSIEALAKSKRII